MMIRPLLIVALACTNLMANAAFAHGGHASDDEKSIPKTCEQLANSKDYVTDVAYPEVKSLKARCSTERKLQGQQKER